MTTITHAIHIVVEISKADKRRLEFQHADVTGLDIKEKAGVPLDSDLARRVEGKLELVTSEQIVHLKNGEHFVVLPPGTIS